MAHERRASLLHHGQSLESELKLLGYSEKGLKRFYTLLRLIIQWLSTKTVSRDFLPTNKQMAVPFFLSTSTAPVDQSTRFFFRLNTSLRLAPLHEDTVNWLFLHLPVFFTPLR